MYSRKDLSIERIDLFEVISAAVEHPGEAVHGALDPLPGPEGEPGKTAQPQRISP